MIGNERLSQIRRRMEAYPELRDVIWSIPKNYDVPIEHRYLAIIEILLNRCERMEQAHVNCPHRGYHPQEELCFCR